MTITSDNFRNPAFTVSPFKSAITVIDTICYSSIGWIAGKIFGIAKADEIGIKEKAKAVVKVNDFLLKDIIPSF
ncbi:MAG: hypothetical protein NTX38_18195 [Methylobacter sp.]|nr:hypothetical protein [Methylobacter sp.]